MKTHFQFYIKMNFFYLTLHYDTKTGIGKYCSVGSIVKRPFSFSQPPPLLSLSLSLSLSLLMFYSEPLVLLPYSMQCTSTLACYAWITFHAFLTKIRSLYCQENDFILRADLLLEWVLTSD